MTSDTWQRTPKAARNKSATAQTHDWNIPPSKGR